MASQVKNGQLDINDIIFPAPAGIGNTRADEWDLDIPFANEPVTISLSSNDYNTFLQVIDANTGNIIADSDDSQGGINSLISPDQDETPNGPGSDDPNIPNSLRIDPSISYKIRVSSYSSVTTFPSSYRLEVRTNSGNDSDITLTERSSTFGNSQTGNIVNVEGELDDSDFTFPVPGTPTDFTVADEFKISSAVIGQDITVGFTEFSNGFSPLIEIVDVANGNVINSGSNSVMFQDPGGNTDYRVRVTSSVPTSTTPVGSYTLQANTNSGEVTLTPRISDDSTVTPDTPVVDPGNSINWTSPIKSSTEPGPTESSPDSDGNPIKDRIYFDSRTNIESYVYDHEGKQHNLTELTSEESSLYIQALNGDDTVTGTNNSDNINGNKGDDMINGGGGDDGDRDPDFPADQVRQALRGGEGGDEVMGGAGNDILNGNKDGDKVDGGNDDDIVRGGKGDDIVIGGEGSDFLFGDNGKDLLIGGTETGDGKDGVKDIFELKDTGVANPSEADLIRGFEVGTDQILLPPDVMFDDLEIKSVELTVDGGSAVSSLQIILKDSSQTLALVENVGSLSGSDFTDLSSKMNADSSLTNEQISLFG